MNFLKDYTDTMEDSGGNRESRNREDQGSGQDSEKHGSPASDMSNEGYTGATNPPPHKKSRHATDSEYFDVDYELDKYSQPHQEYSQRHYQRNRMPSHTQSYSEAQQGHGYYQSTQSQSNQQPYQSESNYQSSQNQSYYQGHTPSHPQGNYQPSQAQRYVQPEGYAQPAQTYTQPVQTYSQYGGQGQYQQPGGHNEPVYRSFANGNMGNVNPGMGYWAPVNMGLAQFGWNPFAMSMGQMVAPVTGPVQVEGQHGAPDTRAGTGQRGARVPRPYLPPTPSPSPPAPRDENRGEEEDLYSSEEEEDEIRRKESGDSGSEVESEKVDTKYKEKVSWALQICKLPTPKSTKKSKSLVMNRKDREKTVFPVHEIMEDQFKKSWESLSGNENFSVNFSTEGPGKPVKLDKKFKPVLGYKKVMRSYAVEGEAKDTKVSERWPWYDWKVDEDFSNVFKGKKPETKTTASKAMLEVGKMLAVLNQMAVFTDASNKIVEEFESYVKPEGQKHWETLKDFLEVKSKSTEDLIALGTNLQMNLLVARREEALEKVDIENHEANVLKFAPPVDQHGRLFNGKLEEFKSWKGRREQTSVVTDLLKSNRKRGQASKSNVEYGKRRRFSEERNQPFRESGRRKDRYNMYKGKGNKGGKFWEKKSGDQKPKFDKRD